MRQINGEAVHRSVAEPAGVGAGLEPDQDERRVLTERVIAHAERFLTGNDATPTFVPGGGPGTADALAEAGIPARGRPIDEVLDLLARHVDVPGVTTTSPRYLGYIPAGGLYTAALADFLAAVSNRYAGLHSVSPGAVAVEAAVVRWLAEVLGLPASAGGVLTSGGSTGTLIAVLAARDVGLDGVGLDPADAARAAVYLSDQAHHSIERALHIAGLGRLNRRVVEVDRCRRIDPAHLDGLLRADVERGVRPWLVVASAGTVNTGAVDPLDEIADIAARYGSWLHVDGAYGGLFALCPEGRALLGGLGRADSIVVDPHKTLFMPYGVGAVLVRSGARLRRAFATTADYLTDAGADTDEDADADADADADGWDPAGPVSPAQLGPELTRPFRGLRVWLPLQVAGSDAFAAALSEKVRLARHLHQRLAALPGIETGPPPDLSIVTFRAAGGPGRTSEQATQALLTRLQEEGKLFVSATRLGGRLVLRAAVLSFRTHLAEVDGAVAVIAAALAADGAGPDVPTTDAAAPEMPGSEEPRPDVPFPGSGARC